MRVLRRKAIWRRVDGREAGVGIQVYDLVQDVSLRIVDVNCSQTAQTNLLFACRLMALTLLPFPNCSSPPSMATQTFKPMDSVALRRA